MMRFTEKAAWAALVFGFAAVILYLTMELRSDVALVPRSVAVLLLVCSGVQLLIDLFPSLGTRLTFLASSAEGSMGGEGVVEGNEDGGREFRQRWLFFGWVALYIVLIYLTSMIIATPLALFVYLKLINRESWRMSVIYPLCMALFIYLVFVLGFRLHYFM